MHPELQALENQLDAAAQDAQAVTSGLSEERGRMRPEPGSQAGAWSIAECLEHLAITHRAYLDAMRPAALRAEQQGRKRRKPALPGFGGRLFIKGIEPPVKAKIRAPQNIQPAANCSLAGALANFLSSQEEVRTFLRSCADLDLARVHFPNPFLRGLPFRLATGLHVIPAHERRHLWQAWRVRRLAESESQP
ncbi:MAG: DinB family protein [Silvibacterium sp.]|nr:DinB family protein [Silvibacterium sp.]